MVLGCQHCFQALLLRSSCSQHSYGPADVPVVRKQPADHTSQAAPALSGRMSRATTRSMSRQASSAHSHHADSDYDGAITSPAPKRNKVPNQKQAPGHTVGVAKGKRKRPDTSGTSAMPPPAKRRHSPEPTACSDHPGLRRSTRATHTVNYCEHDAEDVGMADAPEVPQAAVPRRKRSVTGKKCGRKPWH